MRNGACIRAHSLALRSPETAASLWPAPTVSGNHNAKGASATSGDGLSTAVKKAAGHWPSPMRSDADRGSMAYARGNPTLLGADRAEQDPGPLNPDWTESLMGFPSGWTDPHGPPLVDALSLSGSHPGPLAACPIGATESEP